MGIGASGPPVRPGAAAWPWPSTVTEGPYSTGLYQQPVQAAVPILFLAPAQAPGALQGAATAIELLIQQQQNQQRQHQMQLQLLQQAAPQQQALLGGGGDAAASSVAVLPLSTGDMVEISGHIETLQLQVLTGASVYLHVPVEASAQEQAAGP